MSGARYFYPALRGTAKTRPTSTTHKRVQKTGEKKSEHTSVYHYQNLFTLELYLNGLTLKAMFAIFWPRRVQYSTARKATPRWILAKITTSQIATVLGQIQYLDTFTELFVKTLLEEIGLVAEICI